jgi:hypothetical protein
MSLPIILALAAVVAAAVAGAVLAREKDPQRRAGALVKIGAALMTVFTVAAVAFISGDALDQPGGMAGLMAVLSWFAPMVVLAALAWFRPAGASLLLVALAALLVAVCVWFALDPAAARSIQDSNGPVVAVGVVALAFPASVLGLKRTGTAGWLLLVLGALPLVITLLARSGPAASLAAAGVVPVISGFAYLLAARLARPGSEPRKARSVPA